jgi:hypothetical protein
VLPTRVVVDGERSDPKLELLGGELEALLRDAAQDVDLAVDLAPERRGLPLVDAELVAAAKDARAILVLPSLARVGGQIEVRIVAATPESAVLLVRVERANLEDASVRGVVMLRDLARDLAPRSRPAVSPAVAVTAAPPVRSAGRSVLVTNATLYGGLVGFSVQRASGSDDPRLLYPLLAVGAGIGLGGSMLVAEEWDVGSGDAWYLAAGAWWPTIAAHMIYEGRFASRTEEASERWSFGLVGGVTGIGLTTLALSLHGVGEGSAVLAHSGGGLGLVFGGLTELAIRGDVSQSPFTGMGYGAGLGWLAAAAVATHVDVSPTRALAIDLGALLGGLGGAALASPLMFGTTTPDERRAWLGATAAASLLGGGVAWYVTRAPAKGKGRKARSASIDPRWVPSVGLLGESAAPGERAPIVGVSWQGQLE